MNVSLYENIFYYIKYKILNKLYYISIILLIYFKIRGKKYILKYFFFTITLFKM